MISQGEKNAKNQHFDGRNIIIGPQKVMMLRRLKNNEEHGSCLIIFNDGTKEHGNFKNGKRHGKYTNES